MSKVILTPSDLPPRWHRKYLAAVLTLIQNRDRNKADAEAEAFDLVRSAYFRAAKEAREGDDAPGFDWKLKS